MGLILFLSITYTWIPCYHAMPVQLNVLHQFSSEILHSFKILHNLPNVFQLHIFLVKPE